MSTFTIYTDVWESQKEKYLQEILQKAKIGDRVLYQGPNQMDQMWYIVVEVNGMRDISPISVSYDE